jgi:hypothetical protein
MVGMAGTANAATEIAREHDEIATLVTRVMSLGRGGERISLLHELCARFIIHAQAEERYVYPTLRRLLPEGGCIADTQHRADRGVARIVAKVENSTAAGPDSEELVARLLDGIRGHVARQDALLLPALIEVCPMGEIDRLGEQLRLGLRMAKDAAVRAGMRACEQAESSDTQSADAEVEPYRSGFRALLRHIARTEAHSAAPA